MTRSHGRCARGERLRMGFPRGHRKTIMLVAELRMTGMRRLAVLKLSDSSAILFMLQPSWARRLGSPARDWLGARLDRQPRRDTHRRR